MERIIYDGRQDEKMLAEVLGETIGELMEEDSRVVFLDADLANCSKTGYLKKKYPGRMIDVGIAEADMIGIAAGLSAQGFKPYVHSFGAFASRRCYDQAFLSAGYAGNAITIIGSDPGVTAAYNGGTHMPFEDTGMYRLMPEAAVIDITDSVMLKNILKEAKERPGVKYIRMHRKYARSVFAPGTETPVGKAAILKEGKDAVILASGIMVHEAMQAAAELDEKGISTGVVNVYTIKPLDETGILSACRGKKAVLTAENSSCIGGLYEAVCELFCRCEPRHIEAVAVQDEFGEVGPIEYLQERFGLTKRHIMEKVEDAVQKYCRCKIVTVQPSRKGMGNSAG